MIVNDEYVKNIFLTKCNFISSKSYKKYSNDKKSKIYQYIINRYQDSLSFKESLYRICWDIEETHPLCPICNKLVTVKYKKNDFYHTYCSNICVQHDKEIIKKKERTYFNRTGYTHNSRNPVSKERIKQTCLERYGVEYISKSKEIKEKIKQTCLEKYGVEYIGKSENKIRKVKQTCLEKYGVDSFMKTNEFKKKSEKTCINKYGIYSFSKTKEFKEKYNRNIISTQNKINETKRNNHTFNTSKAEDLAYSFLSKYIDVVRQYNKDARYPWCCDFYIPKLDLFIECNFHWTHGKHPYNENSKEDIQKLNEWKSKETKYYANAIKTWTVYDVKKRNKAKEEKLNFLEFWSLNEFKEYFTKNFENTLGIK